MKLLIIATLIAGAVAVCPNSCSGHGTCDAFDICTCYDEGKVLYFGKEYDPISGAAYSYDNSGTGSLLGVQKQYTGADCSEFTCPRGMSWKQLDSPTEIHQHKDNVECSDAGLCDRSNGECQCFDGYTGSACQRTVCENDCSGHGICQSNIKFALDGGARYSDSLTTVAAWDSGLHFGCKCDSGYRGGDCSLIECPSTADPLNWQGNSEGRDCSGRGICDYSTGLCTCFPGYTQKDCGTVQALA